MTNYYLQGQGSDAIGEFHVVRPLTRCLCGEIPVFGILYTKTATEAYSKATLDLEATILKPTARQSRSIGLTCGCYAKLHRQIAHIQDAQKKRAKRSN